MSTGLCVAIYVHTVVYVVVCSLLCGDSYISLHRLHASRSSII